MPWIEARLQLCRRITFGIIQTHLLDRQRRMPPHDLDRCGKPFPGDRRAQDVVTINDTLQRIDKPIQTRTAIERDQVWQQIGITLLLHQMMEENAFLQRGQRIDVLDIGRTAWGHRNDAIDLLLSECYQRQHLRRDRYAVWPNAIGRHAD